MAATRQQPGEIGFPHQQFHHLSLRAASTRQPFIFNRTSFSPGDAGKGKGEIRSCGLGDGGSLVEPRRDAWSLVFLDLWPRMKRYHHYAKKCFLSLIWHLFINMYMSYLVTSDLPCRACSHLVSMMKHRHKTRWNKQMCTKMQPFPTAVQSTAATLDSSCFYSCSDVYTCAHSFVQQVLKGCWGGA